MAYATVSQVAAGFRELTEEETKNAAALLDEAKIVIDQYKSPANGEAKGLVSCRMVRRVLGDGGSFSFPVGTTQGSMSALGYSQSFTTGSGSALGELYLSRTDKKLLGLSARIGAHSPLEEGRA